MNWLKELPDKYIMLLVFVMIFIAYLTSQLSMLEQLTFMAFGGLTTLLGVRRLQTGDVSTESGDINLPPNPTTEPADDEVQAAEFVSKPKRGKTK